jgi:hypothetical protein
MTQTDHPVPSRGQIKLWLVQASNNHDESIMEYGFATSNSHDAWHVHGLSVHVARGFYVSQPTLTRGFPTGLKETLLGTAAESLYDRICAVPPAVTLGHLSNWTSSEYVYDVWEKLRSDGLIDSRVYASGKMTLDVAVPKFRS